MERLVETGGRPAGATVKAPWAGTRRSFSFGPLRTRVEFGVGKLALLPGELDVLGSRRAVVIATPGHREAAEKLARGLGKRCAGVVAEARQHVPGEVARAARKSVRALGADALIALGGGSSIGLAKAIVMDPEGGGYPIVAIPTTYSGAEMTPLWGVTEYGRKQVAKSVRVTPRSAIYDPETTLSLPVTVSVTSAMNAIAHAVEALYAPDCSPPVAWAAEEGIAALGSAIPGIVADPEDIGARTDALYGGWLGGVCLGAATMSLQHKLCHLLGGAFGLDHAGTHCVLLPHVFAYIAPAAPAAAAAVSRALGRTDPARALYEMTAVPGVPRSLADLGLRERDLGDVVSQVTTSRFPIPRDTVPRQLGDLLRSALHGWPPPAA